MFPCGLLWRALVFIWREKKNQTTRIALSLVKHAIAIQSLDGLKWGKLLELTVVRQSKTAMATTCACGCPCASTFFPWLCLSHSLYCGLTLSWFFLRWMSSSFRASISLSRFMRPMLVSSMSFLRPTMSASTDWRMVSSDSNLDVGTEEDHGALVNNSPYKWHS